MTNVASVTLGDFAVVEIRDPRLLDLALGAAPSPQPDSKDGYCGNVTCGNFQCLDYLCIKI